MDEISDTELDSMLQEVEVEDIEEETAEELQPTALSYEYQPQEIDDDDEDEDDEEGATESPVTEEESVRILSEQDTTSADQLNVDNFSQASTVEFAELRAQETMPAMAAGAEEIASSYSSTASDTDSLSGRKLDEEEEESVGTDALETQEQRPQRPQTLDLQAGLQANAGQTPPPGNEDQAEVQGELQLEQQAEAEGAAGPAQVADDEDDDSPIYEAVGYSDPHANLGKVPPIWVPDNMAGQCMQCQQKFTMIKRRHHCRACGKVLCSVCCSQRFHLQFANEPESRVCVQCFMILTERQSNGGVSDTFAGDPPSALPPTPMRSPNPNNPMEYCSTIPPHCQVNAAGAVPPSVIVPVGVLKKTDGSSSNSSSSDGKRDANARVSCLAMALRPEVSWPAPWSSNGVRQSRRVVVYSVATAERDKTGHARSQQQQ